MIPRTRKLGCRYAPPYMAFYLSFGIQESKFASTGLYTRLTTSVIKCARMAMLRQRNNS